METKTTYNVRTLVDHYEELPTKVSVQEIFYQVICPRCHTPDTHPQGVSSCEICNLVFRVQLALVVTVL